MRHRIALTLLAAVLAAGCSPTTGELAPEPADEAPASPDPTDPEPAGAETAIPADPTDSATEDDAASDEPAEDAAGDVAVSIGDFFFEPDELSVQAGDTVTWTHDGDITHNVTARDGSFVSENLASGERFDHTFTEAGSFEYRCTLHGQMLASIEVS